MELEKLKIANQNIESKKLVEQLTAVNANLTSKLVEINKYILESFNNTLTYANVKRIEELEQALKSKDDEFQEIKKTTNTMKDDYEKKIKKNKLEYDLLTMDYTNALTSNIQKNKFDNDKRRLSTRKEFSPTLKIKKLTIVKSEKKKEIIELENYNCNNEQILEEYLPFKNDKNKRKAVQDKKKPETNKMKKNESKEFLQSNMSNIMYGLNH